MVEETFTQEMVSATLVCSYNIYVFAGLNFLLFHGTKDILALGQWLAINICKRSHEKSELCWRAEPTINCT